MKTLEVVVRVLGVLLILTILVFGGNWYFSRAAKQSEGYKNEIFHESKEYIDGTISEIDKIHTEYTEQSDPMVRKALAGRAKRLIRELGYDKLPADLQSWSDSLEN